MRRDPFWALARLPSGPRQAASPSFLGSPEEALLPFPGPSPNGGLANGGRASTSHHAVHPQCARCADSADSIPIEKTTGVDVHSRIDSAPYRAGGAIQLETAGVSMPPLAQDLPRSTQRPDPPREHVPVHIRRHVTPRQPNGTGHSVVRQVH